MVNNAYRVKILLWLSIWKHRQNCS